MKSNEQLDRLLAEQSSEWLSSSDRNGEDSDPAFSEWLRDSRRNVRTFLMMKALDRELELFDPEKRLSIPELPKHGAEVVPLRGSETTSKARTAGRSWISVRLLSVAAVFVVAVAALITLQLVPRLSGGWQEYATAVGEQRVIELQDGSLIRLNTQSRVAVKFSEGSRDIRLIDGEAIFKVHHDTTRPFRVHTPGAFIQAVGTEFNVYRRAEKTTVAVLEGRVQISQTAGSSTSLPTGTQSEAKHAPAKKTGPYVSAGEQVEIDNAGQVADTHHADVARVTAWSQRRLVFKQESLGEIVMQFNRYNSNPRFKVVGNAVANRRYSGAFNVDDPQSLRALLSGEPDLLVEQQGDEIVIRARLQVHTVNARP